MENLPAEIILEIVQHRPEYIHIWRLLNKFINSTLDSSISRKYLNVFAASKILRDNNYIVDGTVYDEFLKGRKWRQSLFEDYLPHFGRIYHEYKQVRPFLHFLSVNTFIPSIVTGGDLLKYLSPAVSNIAAETSLFRYDFKNLTNLFIELVIVYYRSNKHKDDVLNILRVIFKKRCIDFFNTRDLIHIINNISPANLYELLMNIKIFSVDQILAAVKETGSSVAVKYILNNYDYVRSLSYENRNLLFELSITNNQITSEDIISLLRKNNDSYLTQITHVIFSKIRIIPLTDKIKDVIDFLRSAEIYKQILAHDLFNAAYYNERVDFLEYLYQREYPIPVKKLNSYWIYSESNSHFQYKSAEWLVGKYIHGMIYSEYNIPDRSYISNDHVVKLRPIMQKLIESGRYLSKSTIDKINGIILP